MCKWESLRAGWGCPCGGLWGSVGASVGEKNLTLIGLSNRHVHLPLSQGRGYEVGFFSWSVSESVFQSKCCFRRHCLLPLGGDGRGVNVLRTLRACKWESLRGGWDCPCGGLWVSAGASVGESRPRMETTNTQIGDAQMGAASGWVGLSTSTGSVQRLRRIVGFGGRIL